VGKEMKACLIGNGRWGQILESYIKKYFDLISIQTHGYDISGTDVVFVATPIETHYQIVKDCLMQGKHVFCEKPLSMFYIEAQELERTADIKGLKLHIDFTDSFNPDIQIDFKPLEMYACNFKQADEKQNIMWHLHCHFLAILDKFVDIDTLEFNFRGNVLSFTGDMTGSIVCDMQTGLSLKRLSIIGQDKEFIYGFNKPDILDYSVKAFKDSIDNGTETNIKTAVKVTKTIEQVLRCQYLQKYY
jgi:hypothetical protein